MQKSSLIAYVAEQTGVDKKLARQVIETTLETISQRLAQGEKVVLTGFGTFEMRLRRERRGVNPQTREAMVIPESRIPGFSASSQLRDLVQEQQGRERGA